MPRRWASGHIEATQLSKLAAASRIAAAVIRGWPEAPSSPLQGGAPLLPPGAGGAASDFGPEKMLLKKLETELPPCARAWPHDNSAAATMIAPASFCIRGPAARSIFKTRTAEIVPASGALVTVANSLTKGQIWTAICLREDPANISPDG